MKIELDDLQVGEIAAKKIAALEKEVRALNAKLRKRDETLARLRNGMDVTKGRRDRVRALAEQLRAELESAGWVEPPDYGL